MPKTITGYWFCDKSMKLPNGDGREIRVGVTHKVDGEIIPCKNGLHASERTIDALKYAPGTVACKVSLGGVIVPHNGDKHAASERTYLAIADAGETLRLFARRCALDVIHLWEPPDVVLEYLKTGRDDLRDAGRAAAQTAAWEAAWDAARAAAWDAARAAAWAAQAAAREATWEAAQAAARAAWAAAREAAQTAAWEATRDAAWAAQAAARATARDAAERQQNRRLAKMLSDLWRRGNDNR